MFSSGEPGYFVNHTTLKSLLLWRLVMLVRAHCVRDSLRPPTTNTIVCEMESQLGEELLVNWWGFLVVQICPQTKKKIR
jgi:hypothetical protein